MDLRNILKTGHWESIAVEVRPSGSKNEDGSLKPFYLTRDFKYFDDDKFELTIKNFADPFGKIEICEIFIRGHIEFLGDFEPIFGAKKVKFVADEKYDLTAKNQGFVDILNKITKNFEPWKIDQTQSIFQKEFLPFGQKEGEIFQEYDLIYVLENFLFWGARNIDGRGFETEQNDPNNLQIPLIHKK